jgi:2-phosphosulfolactate phosphatase
MAAVRYYPLSEAHLAEGAVVVVDVLRAFTTAAYAFASGAKEIFPAAGVEDALALRDRIPGSLVMGEVDGHEPEAFDFGNSPSAIRQADLHDRTLIQRTSAGTQGIIRAVHADRCFAASFVVARATAERLRMLEPEVISFIITGESKGRDGDEDRACGEYIEALFKGYVPDPDVYTVRVLTSTVGRDFLNLTNDYLLKDDIEISQRVDAFNFYMPVNQKGDLLVISKDEFP